MNAKEEIIIAEIKEKLARFGEIVPANIDIDPGEDAKFAALVLIASGLELFLRLSQVIN